MKLIKQIYQDKHGNHWLVEKHTLPKKKGEWHFWTAECINSLNQSYRADSKKDLFLQIKNKQQ